MNNLISKTALLRALDMAVECKDCPRNTDRKTYYERCACSEVADICNIITEFATFADVQPVSQWISVKDRLPIEKGEYLVAYHPCYWDNVKPELCVGIDTFRGKTTWAKKKYQRVVAWMPKPEAYKESEE